MQFKINKYLIDDIENDSHPSDFENVKDYAVLILRLPYIKDDKVEVVSYAFLIKNGEVYKYDRSKTDFIKLGNFNDLYEYLDVRIDKILAKISKLHVNIEKMEDALYDEKIDSNFVNEWLNLKKELSLIERLMGHCVITLDRFIKYFKDEIDEFAFKDLNEHINRAFRFSKDALEKLDNLYNFYRAKMDEKTNNIMFVLTIISAIFLPLGLLTGFFGMNTGGLPFLNDPNGTIKVIFLSLLFEMPFIYLIWKMMKKG